MKKLYCLTLALVIIITCYSQNKELDSLCRTLDTYSAEDSVRVILLNSACYYKSKIDPEKSRAIATEALRIATKLHYRRGIRLSQKYLASYYREMGDYAMAKEYYLKAADIFDNGNIKIDMS